MYLTPTGNAELTSYTIELWQIKVAATKQFKLGIKGYLFATAHYLVWMAPGPIKHFFYKYFR